MTAPTDGNSSSSIVISADPRDSLTQIPNIEFNGQYETTARPELGTGGGDDGGGSSDGSALSTSAPETATDTADTRVDSIAVPGNPGQTIEPGTLTAGDYDDHLNPYLYQTYANEYLQRRGQWIDIPRMDFNHRIRIAATDQSGLPYTMGNSQSQLTSTQVR